MKNFFRSMRVFIRALPHFLLFEFLFKLILIAIGAPILALTLKLTMKAAGIAYIYDESLLAYLHSPVTIFFALILLLVVGTFAFVELTALAACFSCYSRGETITVGGMLRTGLKCFKKAFRPRGGARFLGFTLFMPFTEFTLSSGMFMAPILPILRRIFGGISGHLAVTAYIVIQALFIMIVRLSRQYTDFEFSSSTEKRFNIRYQSVNLRGKPQRGK